MHRYYPQWSVEEYHQAPMISSGSLKAFISGGPYKYWNQYIAGNRNHKDSKALSFGSAFHLAMSIPDWERHIWETPIKITDTDFTDEWRKRWFATKTKATLKHGEDISLRFAPHRDYLEIARKRASSEGKLCVEWGDTNRIQQMKNAVLANPQSRRFVDRGLDAEKPCVLEEGDIKSKALADLVVSPDELLDFKTCVETTKSSFINRAYKLGYHLQAAHYCHVFGAKEFYICSITKEAPYEAMFYRIPRHELEKARETCASARSKIALCAATGSWHSEGWGTMNNLESEYF